jgi:anti-sigma B factor antagonist
MNRTGANLLVAVADHEVCVKVVGRANFTCSLDMKRVIHEMLARGYRRFVLDVSECLLMDSTFLGMLAGIGLKFAEPGEHGQKSLELLNPNPRICDLLENLGVDHLFKIIREQPAPEDDGFQSINQANDKDRAELTRNSLEAHETLMRINPNNVPKFKDVAQFLAEDLKRLEEKPKE